MLDSIRIERRYSHPIDKVWRALTDPTLVSQWLMPTDLRAEEGHSFTFTTQPRPGFDGVVHCRMVTVNRPSRLVYTWVGGGIDTVVRFDLEIMGPTSTLLRFEQTGFSGLYASIVARSILSMGWKKLLGSKMQTILSDL